MAVSTELLLAGSDSPPRPRLGELLIASGSLAPSDLDRALAVQISTRSRSRLGDVLLAEGRIGHPDLIRALSRQYEMGRVDLIAAPPDPDLLDLADPLSCLRLGYVPWRQIGKVTILAVGDPAAISGVMTDWSPKGSDLAFALAAPDTIRHHVSKHFQDVLEHRSTNLCPDDYACRGVSSRIMLGRLLALTTFCAAISLALPGPILTLLLVLMTLANICTASLRLLAFGAMVVPEAPAVVPAEKLGEASLPVISVLVPLYREGRMLDGLLAALDQIDYPHALLDVKLVLEADDSETAIALGQAALPNWISVVTVPAGPIRTKPRAMNYALPFCRGDIIGIYDAEDRPEADQLRKVAAAFQAAPRELACVQGALDFYNPDANWLTRMFTAEYAQWFQVILPGLQRLGLPIPLGGTTVFFRRKALENLGGWDAHNVTEDADLGIRLARKGYRCAILQSTTREEATSSLPAWIRQRSRWLKGYALTWSSHMRDPAALLDDLGLAGFLCVQTLLLFTLASFMALPLHAALWASIALGRFGWMELAPAPVWLWFSVSHLLSLSGLVLVTLRALLPRERRRLLLWQLSLPLYWPLGGLAACRALAGAMFAPFYWAKTEHGLAQENPPASAFSRTSKAAER